jgi:hypothetical protein
MNEIVDNLANKARKLPLPPLEERTRFFAHCPIIYLKNNSLISSHPRKHLKKAYRSSFPLSDYSKYVHNPVKYPYLYTFFH